MSTLLVRAVTRGLLDPGQGCPLTHRYAIREAAVLQELQREEEAALKQAYLSVLVGQAQILYAGPNLRPELSFFESAVHESMLTYQRLGGVLQPWNPSWKEQEEKTKTLMADSNSPLAKTGISASNIPMMIREFNETRKRRQQRKNAAKQPRSSADDGGKPRV